MPNPNPAQQRRNRIIAAIREQQGVITRQANEIAELRQAVATLAVAAGVGNHPRFARLVRQSGLRFRADSAQNPEGAPATTTEEAKQPQATDDVENIGAAPAPANQSVTPEGVTDVNTTDVTVNPPVIDNLQDVTQPVAGTDSVDPSQTTGEGEVRVSEPSQETSDLGNGWTAARGNEQERFVASLRLARLRIQAGIEQGEDLALAQRISSGKESLGEINAQVTALSAVASRQPQAPTAHQARRLVPQRAASRGAGVVPMTQQPSMQAVAATSERPDEDQWLIGGVDG